MHAPVTAKCDYFYLYILLSDDDYIHNRTPPCMATMCCELSTERRRGYRKFIRIKAEDIDILAEETDCKEGITHMLFSGYE